MVGNPEAGHYYRVADDAREDTHDDVHQTDEKAEANVENHPESGRDDKNESTEARLDRPEDPDQQREFDQALVDSRAQGYNVFRTTMTAGGSVLDKPRYSLREGEKVIYEWIGSQTHGRDDLVEFRALIASKK